MSTSTSLATGTSLSNSTYFGTSVSNSTSKCERVFSEQAREFRCDMPLCFVEQRSLLAMEGAMTTHVVDMSAKSGQQGLPGKDFLSL